MMVISRFIMFLTIYALVEIPNDDMKNERKRKRDKSVSLG